MSRDIVEQALDMVRKVDARGALMRLFGGAAVSYLVRAPILERHPPRDLDFVCLSKHILVVRDVLISSGYQEDLPVTRLFGSERRRFRHQSTGLAIDLCLDRLRFSRVIDLRGRLHIRPVCIPVADLLLAKMQAREFTTIDLIDVVNLLAEFEPSDVEADKAFDAERVAFACSRDWGLYQLVLDNSVAVEDLVLKDPRCAVRRAELLVRVAAMRRGLSAHAKSASWRVRAWVGKRMRYWDEVSEGDDVG